MNFDEKLILSERIQNISDQKILYKILTLIKKNNKNIKITKNNNGYFLVFQNLTNNTYNKLVKIVDNYDKQQIPIILSSESNSYVNTLSKNNTYSKNNIYSKKLKLTNIEHYLINRINYENEFKKNENHNSSDINID